MKRIFALLVLVFSFSRILFAEHSISLPILDLNDYKQPQTKARFMRQMKNTLEEMGFFVLLNFGIHDETMTSCFSALEQFFNLDFEVKKRYLNREVHGQRGYVPGESAKGEYRRDLKEFFTVGRENGSFKTYENIWPQEFSLKSPLLRLYAEIESGKEMMEEAFSEALGMNLNYFHHLTKEGESLLRGLHYPANPPRDCVWAAEHTDINLFTISLPASSEGLQYKTKEGEWISVPVPKNAVIIHCGDMMENLTNGLFKSAVHRVCDLGLGKDRYSFVFFTHSPYSDRMDPLPRCIEMTGGRPLYPSATARELLEERLVDLGLATYDMMQHLAASGLMERLIDLNRASPKALKALDEAGLASEKMKEALCK